MTRTKHPTKFRQWWSTPPTPSLREPLQAPIKGKTCTMFAVRVRASCKTRPFAQQLHSNLAQPCGPINSLVAIFHSLSLSLAPARSFSSWRWLSA